MFACHLLSKFILVFVFKNAIIRVLFMHLDSSITLIFYNSFNIVKIVSLILALKQTVPFWASLCLKERRGKCASVLTLKRQVTNPP